MKTLKLAAQLNKASRRADDSVAITFVTAEEVNTELFGQIDEWRKQSGFVLFKKNDFALSEIPTANAKIEGQRSPSQRLRLALYAKHMNTGGSKETFPEYYDKVIEGFIQATNDSYDSD